MVPSSPSLADVSRDISIFLSIQFLTVYKTAPSFAPTPPHPHGRKGDGKLLAPPQFPTSSFPFVGFVETLGRRNPDLCHIGVMWLLDFSCGYDFFFFLSRPNCQCRGYPSRVVRPLLPHVTFFFETPESLYPPPPGSQSDVVAAIFFYQCASPSSSLRFPLF